MIWVISVPGGSSHPGMDLNHTAQLVMAKSDDGKDMVSSDQCHRTGKAS